MDNATVELRPDGFHVINDDETVVVYYVRYKAQVHADKINAGDDVVRPITTADVAEHLTQQLRAYRQAEETARTVRAHWDWANDGPKERADNQ